MLKEITQEMQNELLALAKTLKGWDNCLQLKNCVDKMMGFPDLYNLEVMVLEYCEELIDDNIEDAEKFRVQINSNLPVIERSGSR